ncbi:MAG: sugar phosphate isomerase/epimerase family protein [Acidobacteriota bacterium]
MTNRRSFLSASAAASSSLALAQSPSPPPSHPIKLGVASYSLREFSRNLAIKSTKQLGVQFINIKEFHLPYIAKPDDIDRGRKQFENAGLTILGGGTVTFHKEDDNDIRAYFEYAKRAGMPLIVAAPTHKTLPKLEKFVKEYDIKIAVHNHGPEDKYFPSSRDALAMMKNMDPRIGVCCDIGHESRAGKDILETLQLAGPRLLDMHVKDLKNPLGKDSQCDVGDGILPIVAIFKYLKKIHYSGGVMLEYEINGDNPLTGMAKSFSYMRGVLAALA